jgi:SOS-response transcriptional repressor LexA
MRKGKEGLRLGILAFVEAFVSRNGYSPTLDEVAGDVGLIAKSSARRHLKIMRGDGLVDWQEGCPRTLRLTPGGSSFLAQQRVVGVGHE